MVKQIKSTFNRRSYFNEITTYLDDYLLKCDYCDDHYRNYIYEEPFGNKWLIRVPGFTAGNIVLDENNIILEINLYEDSFCYRREVLDNLDQFIGAKLIIGKE